MDLKSKKGKIMAGCLGLAVLCVVAALFFGISSKKTEMKVTGIKDVTLKQGETLPDLTEDVTMPKGVGSLTIDASKVDEDTPGTYPITYIYEDKKGNRHEKEVTCTVTAAKAEEAVTEEAVTEQAVTDEAQTEEQ